MTPTIRTFAAAVLTLGCAAGTLLGETKINAGGASFPDPVYQRWVAAYHQQNPDVTINYESVGSGGGIRGITDKTYDFAGSDAPLSKKEKDKAPAPLMHLPTVAGAVVAAYNLPGFNGDLKLDGPTLADIYLGKVRTWSDPAIAALNPGANLPDLPITPVYRSDGSGTSYVFTSYLATQSGEFKDRIGAGKSVDFPRGQGAQKNPGVTAAVKATRGAIGYIELTYATENKIPFALMKNKDGKFVKASPKTVSDAGEGAVKDMSVDGMDVDIWNQPGADAYPIAAFTYIIVYRDLDYLGSKEKAQAMVKYLKWATTGEKAQKMAADMNYAPLSKGVQDKDAAAIDSLTYGGQKLGGM